MVSKRQRSKDRRRKIVNLIGATGYINVAIQWVLVGALFIPFLVDSPLLKPEPATPDNSSVVMPPSSVAEPNILTFFLVAAIVLVMFGITAYILTKMPASIAKSGKKVVHGSSAALTTAFIKKSGKRDSKKLRERITPQLTLIVKGFIILAPVAVAYVSTFFDDPTISPVLMIFISVILANLSFVLFFIQHSLAHFLSVKRTELW